MSHFLTFILVPISEADVATRARTLILPFFANDLGDAPEAKCDGFVIGGRFDGQLFGAKPMHNLTPTEFQSRYGLDVIREEDNIRPASEVSPDLIPYAVVTPEGEWFDCEAQWDNWPMQVHSLLHQFADHFVVAFDCHS